jgi:hypothetical protein
MVETLISESIQTLAKSLADAKRKVDEAERDMSFLKDAESAARDALLKRMEAEEIKSFHIPGVGKFTMFVSTYPRAVGDKEEVIRWFDAQGVDIAPRTIAKARLREEFENRQENSQPLPPENIVQVYREMTVRTTLAS